jgi:hypothetical protein
MHEDGQRVAMLLSEEEAACLLDILLATAPSEMTDQLLCRIADVQRLLNRHRSEPVPARPGPPCCTSRAA